MPTALTLKCRGRRSPGIIRRVARALHQPRPARHRLRVGAQSCSGPYVDGAEPCFRLVGHVLLFGVAERSDSRRTCIAGPVEEFVGERKAPAETRHACAANAVGKPNLAHQNPTQEKRDVAEFAPNVPCSLATRTSNPR